MVSVCRLHDLGVLHNQLLPFDDHDHVKVGPAGPVLFDFTQAERHKCGGAYPRVAVPRKQVYDETHCRELVDFERAVGPMTGSSEEVVRVLRSYSYS